MLLSVIVFIFASFQMTSSCSPKSITHSKKIFDISTQSAFTGEYIFLSDVNGKVTILSSSSNEVIITYHLPKISESLVAMIGEKLYSIDTVDGFILSTALKNILNPPKSISWDIIASFPKEQDWIRNGIAINDSSIYFITKSGILYLFDTRKETISKMGEICKYSNYASLIIVNNILYIHKCKYFYSFDEKIIQELVIPDARYDSGLFKFGNSVCRVGGNLTDIFPDPVYCYDVNEGTWAITSHINEARIKPGIVATESGTYIFGGKALYNSGKPSSSWRSSVEVFDRETELWKIIQSPFSIPPEHPQAVAFYF